MSLHEKQLMIEIEQLQKERDELAARVKQQASTDDMLARIKKLESTLAIIVSVYTGK